MDDTLMRDDTYRLFVPIEDHDLLKSVEVDENGDYIVKGVMTSEDKDEEDDSITPEGMDCSYFLEKGWIKYEHGNRPEQFIGEPIEVKVGQFEHPTLLKLVKGILIKGRLFAQRELARQAVKAIEDLQKSNTKRKMGWSIEGGVRERDRKTQKITKSIIRNVVLTMNPVNTMTWAELAKSFDKHNEVTVSIEVPEIPEAPEHTEVQKALNVAAVEPINRQSIEGFDPDKMVTYDYFDIVDEKGSKIPNKLLEREKTQIEVERRLDSNAATYDIIRNRVLIKVDIPAMGYRTYALRPRVRNYITNPQPGSDRAMIARGEGILENEKIRVAIKGNGTFDLLDKSSGKKYTEMHYFCDNGSLGGAHQNKTPMRDYTVTSLGNSAQITLLENNALRATWQIDLKMHVPASAHYDGTNRSEQKVEIPITTQLTLKKGSDRLEIKTTVCNSARDHRLRVMFPTDIKTDFAYASAPFDVVKRKIQWLVTADNMEGHYPFQPMQDFVTLSDDSAGLSFMSRGLGEYEVIDDARRTLAITLLRTHRAYMLANRGAKTPDEYARQRGQHCLETMELNYALYPHKGSWSDAQVIARAQDYKTPFRVIQGVPKQGELPATDSLVRIVPAEHVQLSAFYRNEQGAYILRVWNSSDKPVDAMIETPVKFKSAQKISLDETRQVQELSKASNGWNLPLRKAEIATLRLSM
jgi:hypothetical protein